MAYRGMNSEKFEDLDEELEGLCADIKSSINDKIPGLAGGNKYILQYNWLTFLEINWNKYSSHRVV